MWGCKQHWFKLPAAIRGRIWRAYRIGQESNLSLVSGDYLDAADEAEHWIAANAGKGESRAEG